MLEAAAAEAAKEGKLVREVSRQRGLRECLSKASTRACARTRTWHALQCATSHTRLYSTSGNPGKKHTPPVRSFFRAVVTESSDSHPVRRNLFL